MSIQTTGLLPVAPSRGAGSPGASRSGARDEGQRSFGDLLDTLVGEGRSAEEPHGLGGPATGTAGTPGTAETQGAPGAAAGEGATSGSADAVAILEAGLLGVPTLLAAVAPTGTSPVAPAGVVPTSAGAPTVAPSGPVASHVDLATAPATVTTAADAGTTAAAGPGAAADVAPVVAGQQAATPATPGSPGAVPAPAGAEQTPATATAAGPVEGAGSGTSAQDGGGAGAGPEGQRPADGSAPTQPGAQTTSQAGASQATSGPSAVVAAAPTGPAPTAAPPVSQQLFDAVHRLTRSGDGAHRMTVRLDPGSLGEVRVQLVTRDGVLQVHLSAGPEALAALGEGSSELHRLLQSTGASEVRVTVRDLGGDPGQQRPDQQRSDQQRSGQDDWSAHDTGTDGFAGGSAGGFDRGTQRGSDDVSDLLARMQGSTTASRGPGQGGPASHDPAGWTPLRVDLAL